MSRLWWIVLVAGLTGCPGERGSPGPPASPSPSRAPAPPRPTPSTAPPSARQVDPPVADSPAAPAEPSLDLSPLPPFPPETPATGEQATARRLAAELAPLDEVEAPLMRALSAAADDAARDRVLVEFLQLLDRRAAYSRLAKLTQQVLGGDRPTLPRAELRYLQGLAWVGLGQEDGARQAWGKVAALDDPALALSAEAEVALLDGESARAAQLARRAVSAEPGRREPRSLFARAVVADHPQVTRRELAALVARHPDDLNARFQLASVADRLGDDAAVAEHLGAVITLGEGAPLPLAQLRRARALWRVARFAEAEATLDRYLEAHPDDLEAMVWRAGCWYGAGQTERAQAQWRLLARERGPELRAYLHAGGRQLGIESLRPALQAALD